MNHTDREALQEQVRLLEMKLIMFKNNAADKVEMKKIKVQLQDEKQENLRIKKAYERSCAEMKSEFSKIKTEMELTWAEQKQSNEKNVHRL